VTSEPVELKGDGEDPGEEIAAATATAARSAAVVATQAHQTHGAIGMTKEYPVHEFNRRLWALAQMFGPERHRARFLGSRLLNNGVTSVRPPMAAGRFAS
jgi:acyl-CoA dehydrogenase